MRDVSIDDINTIRNAGYRRYMLLCAPDIAAYQVTETQLISTDCPSVFPQNPSQEVCKMSCPKAPQGWASQSTEVHLWISMSLQYGKLSHRGTMRTCRASCFSIIRIFITVRYLFGNALTGRGKDVRTRMCVA